MAKKVAVIIRTSPFNTLKSVEAFRLGIGLTLEGNKVDLLLMEKGVWNSLSGQSRSLERPDVDQFIQSMELCGVNGFVDSETLPTSYHSRIRGEFQKKTKEELLQMIHQADIVVPF
jgi:sulfur relay (sulfurtransferase) DsrF/TusC family protein